MPCNASIQQDAERIGIKSASTLRIADLPALYGRIAVIELPAREHPLGISRGPTLLQRLEQGDDGSDLRESFNGAAAIEAYSCVLAPSFYPGHFRRICALTASMITTPMAKAPKRLPAAKPA